VRHVAARRVQWVPSAKGPVMQEIAGSEFLLNAEMVLLAMGFDPVPDSAMAKQLELPLDAKGKVQADGCTAAEGVFICGDVQSGASYVATAIDSGRYAAAKIEEYLARRGEGEKPGLKDHRIS
jgi:glutamate synthase (NADPH) small chain